MKDHLLMVCYSLYGNQQQNTSYCGQKPKPT